METEVFYEITVARLARLLGGDCLPPLDPRDTLTSEPNHKANIPTSCLLNCCTGQYTTPAQPDYNIARDDSETQLVKI